MKTLNIHIASKESSLNANKEPSVCLYLNNAIKPGSHLPHTHTYLDLLSIIYLDALILFKSVCVKLNSQKVLILI